MLKNFNLALLLFIKISPLLSLYWDVKAKRWIVLIIFVGIIPYYAEDNLDLIVEIKSKAEQNET